MFERDGTPDNKLARHAAPSAPRHERLGLTIRMHDLIPLQNPLNSISYSSSLYLE
jgi:hypothetical protein